MHANCRKRHSSSSISSHQENTPSKFREAKVLFDEESVERRPNAALFLENIKHEAEGFDDDYSAKMHSASKRRSSIDSYGFYEVDITGVESVHRSGSYSLKTCKIEEDALTDGGETTFALFASLLDSALQGTGHGSY